MADGVSFGAGNSTTSNTLAAGAIGMPTYYTSAATSSTTYGRKNTLYGTGAGAEFIGGRDRTILSAIAANAHGYHGTLEVNSTGRVTGLGTGIRGNIVFSTDTLVTGGTYYGVMGEIYPIGATGALPAGSNACLCASAPTGTASDLVVNALAVNGADGTGKMIYTATDTTVTHTGSIRILVNGAIRYIHFASAQAAGS